MEKAKLIAAMIADGIGIAVLFLVVIELSLWAISFDDAYYREYLAYAANGVLLWVIYVLWQDIRARNQKLHTLRMSEMFRGFERAAREE